MDIYVLQTRHKPWCFCFHEAEPLLIVAVYDRLLFNIKLNAVKKSFPPKRLPGRF